MNIDRIHSSPAVIDVSGLSPDAVREVELFVTHLSRFGTLRGPTDDEFDRSLRELASGPAVPTLPADWSRADLYDEHD